MQESWGRFLVSSGGTTYDVRGSGTSLSNHVNQVVQVRGLPDTKSAQGNTVPLYAQQVQDTGQACGANAGMNAQNTGQPGTPAAGGAMTTGTQPATTGATAQPGAPASTGEPAEAQPGQAPQTTPQTASPQAGTTPQAAAGQTGTSNDTMQPGGSTEAANQPNEAKGTPTEGTPSPAVAAPAASSGSASAASSQQANLSTFTGCLSGKENQYQYKSNGKTYRLQGNTTMLQGLAGHQVEITGEDFNGKAIQVNGARDLGSSCSK